MLNGGRDPMDKVSTYRPRDETAEERAERKKAVKQERRVRLYSLSLFTIVHVIKKTTLNL